MLDQLSNVDLSGITGRIIYDNSVDMIPGLLKAIGLLILVGFLIYYFMKILNFAFPKSLEYRKNLVNLYVAGKIKQMAKKDSIDLDVEALEFRKYELEQKLKLKDLDSAIEEKLKEEVMESPKKAITK